MFKCIIKCWFETVGILNNKAIWIREKVLEYLWPGAVDALEVCLKDLQLFDEVDVEDPCKISYSVAKCMIKLRNMAFGIAKSLEKI